MNEEILLSLGLNETQASAYISLVERGKLTPPELADELDIKRTNAYAVLDQLVDMGLASKKEVKKKFTYFAESPAALEELARRRREQAVSDEKVLAAALPEFMNRYNLASNKPGVAFYQGVDGIKEIYDDVLRTCKDNYVFRSSHDQDLMSTDFYIKFKDKRAKLGIKTHMINPENDPDFWNDETDKRFNLIRTVIPPAAYTADAEIATYGDKVSIISFGKEAIGMIITSPEIAKAMREIYRLATAENHK